MALSEYLRKPILPDRLGLGFQLLLLALFCSPLFIELARSSVWDANEAFYVQTPREMVESGDWIHPTFNGRPRVNKPPLSYWLVAIPYSLFGPDLFWERLLLALSGTLSLVAVFQMGRLFFDRGWAFVATGIFATNFRFLVISKRLLIDSLLLSCSLWAIALFLFWLYRRRRHFAVLSGLCFGLGVLAKGPVAFIPLMIVLLFLLLSGRWKELPLSDALIGTAVLAITGASWFLLLGWSTGWESVWNFILSENLGRYLSEDYGPRRGIFYYVGVYLADFFPWSILSVPAIAAALASLWNRDRRAVESPILLFLIWFAFYLILFSFSRNKQEYYILPLYPAAAFLLTAFLAKRHMSRPWAVGIASLMMLAAGLLVLLGTLLFGSAVWYFLPPLALVAAAVSFLIWRNWVLAPALSLFFLLAFAVYSAPMEEYKPVFPLSQIMMQEVRTDDDPASISLGYYRVTAPSLRFYVDRDIAELYETDDATRLLRQDHPVYLITDRPGLESLENKLDFPLEIVATRPKLYTTARTLLEALKASKELESVVLTREVLLVSNRSKAGKRT